MILKIMYSRKPPTSAEALKEKGMPSRLAQCFNQLLTCLTETSGSADADFWEAIRVLKEGRHCCLVFITHCFRHQSTLTTVHPLCFSHSTGFLSFTDEIPRSCVTVHMGIIKWFKAIQKFQKRIEDVMKMSCCLQVPVQQALS